MPDLSVCWNLYIPDCHKVDNFISTRNPLMMRSASESGEERTTKSCAVHQRSTICSPIFPLVLEGNSLSKQMDFLPTLT